MLQISKLLKKHQLRDITDYDANGDTILHLAMKNEELTQEEKIKILDISLNKGVDPNAENKINETVLKLAIASRARDIIDILLARNVYVDDSIAEYMIRSEKEKFRKLFKKAFEFSDPQVQKKESESTDFIEWFLSKDRLNVDHQNHHGHSAVYVAIKCNLQHLLPVLLKCTNDIEYIEPKTKSTLLHLFLKKNASLRDFWNSTEWSFDDQCIECLHSNYTHRHASGIIKIMLERDIFTDAVDADGNTALHVAIAEEESNDIIEMLIKRTMNINDKNSEGETPLNIAISKWTSLSESESNDWMKISSSLIAKGADVNVLDKNGMSPLCIAIGTHHLKAVELLSGNNADFNVTLPNGESLLHLLVKYRYSLKTDEEKIKLFDVLISNGCKINARDKSGNTALHQAAKMGDVVITQKLVENGAEINCKNNHGETPLCCLDCILDKEGYMFRHENIPRSLQRGNDSEQLDLMYGLYMGSRDMRVLVYNKMLKILLKHGADFKEQVLNGYSVLRIAVWRIYEEGKYELEITKALDKDEELTLSDSIPPEEIQSLTEFLHHYNRDKINLLLIHWIRLEAANLKCNTTFEYTDLIEEEKFKKIDVKCREEIKKLKDYFIDSRTTLYSLLHMDLNRRRAYINNEKLQKLLQSPKLEEKFPEYSVLIFASIQEAITRKSLMDPAKKVWLALTKIELPEVCIEHIFSFLSNAEMFDLIGKFRSTD